MKRIFISLALLVAPFVAVAQDDISQSSGIIGNGKYLGAKTADGQTTVPVLGVDANGNTVINALSGKSIMVMADKTPVQLSGLPAAVITPLTSYNATPSAGATLTRKISAVATAAPTAVFVQLPVATTIPGQVRQFYNEGANPSQIVPVLGDAINATAAGTPFACATTKFCECTAAYNGRYVCVAHP